MFDPVGVGPELCEAEAGPAVTVLDGRDEAVAVDEPLPSSDVVEVVEPDPAEVDELLLSLLLLLSGLPVGSLPLALVVGEAP